MTLTIPTGTLLIDPSLPGGDAIDDAVGGGLLGEHVDALRDIIPAAVLDELLASTNLTPEMVLAMTRSKLKDLDTQLQGVLSAIQDTTKHTELLNNKIENLQDLRRQLSEAGMAPGDVYELTDAQQEALDRLGIPLDEETSITELDAEIDKLRADIEEINSGTEMLMMQAQTLSGQRSTALQTGSSIIKKMSDGMMGIVGNI